MTLSRIWLGWIVVLGTVLANRAAWGIEEGICRYCNHEHFEAAGEAASNGRQYAPRRLADIRHLRIDVTPDFGTRTVRGTTTIELVPIGQPLVELPLDAMQMRIDDVRSTRPLREYVSTDQNLTLVFDPPVPAGDRISVEIDYSAEPAQGLYFRTAAQGYPEGDTHLWTQGQTHEARHWFPVFDYPNEKSSTEVICRVPADMVVLSNGKELSNVVEAESGLRRVHWLQEKPHANYLVCLVAGHFQGLEKRHRDIPLRFFAQPSLIEHAANSFADTAEIMAFFEEEIGVPFPWNKYDQVTILDFTAGGMENTTLTTLTHRTIFSAETENIRTTRDLDAHEMAHQWFGDYVTCKDWSHLWLNEGFATFYTHLYEGHKFGRDTMLYGLYQDARERILPNKQDRRPIVYRKYQSSGEQFDYRNYPKASWVLHMLRSQLGPELYRKAIKTYLERHAYRNVVSDDLREVLEELSGKPHDRFFDQWLYHGGAPELRVGYRWLANEKLAEITVQQTQTVNDEVLHFDIPTQVRFWCDDDLSDPITQDIAISGAQSVFHVPLPRPPVLVRFDPETTVLADVTFPLSDVMWRRQLRNPADMIGRLEAIRGLQSRRTRENTAALAEALRSDAFFGVRVHAAGALARMKSDEARQALRDGLEQSDPRARLAVVRGLASFFHPAAKEKLLEIVARERNPIIVAAALGGLGKYRDEEVVELMESQLDRPSFGSEIELAAVDALQDLDANSALSLLEKRIAAANTPERRDVLPRLLTVYGRLGRHATDREGPRKLLASFVSHPRTFVRFAAISGLAELRDRSAAAILRDLGKTAPDDRIGAFAREALARIDREASFVPREVVELRQSLRQLEGQVKQLQEELRRELSKQRVSRPSPPAAEPRPARDVPVPSKS